MSIFFLVVPLVPPLALVARYSHGTRTVVKVNAGPLNLLFQVFGRLTCIREPVEAPGTLRE